ncbi:MAG TPA: hypothetical protein VFD90_09710 [Gaiellales bacterium]|jgi:hypothetical protein|nr:hypothetical protein [Gaiellales bacterium]
MIELELTRIPNNRRTYRLDGIGTVRLEGWFGRTGSAQADDSRSWRFTRRGLWKRIIEADDATGALVGEFTPRDIRRGGWLRWGTRELKLQPVSMRERYVLNESGHDIALLSASGWGKRPVKITVAHPHAIDSGLLLFAAFAVHQLAGDSLNAASSGSAAVASTGAYSG